jgi:predicted O-linked N-acetylglucosamine transferase (SPINDLY family)
MQDKSQLDLIISLFSNGKVQEALDQIDPIIQDNSNDAVLFNIRGACYAHIGEPIMAIKQYEKAVEIDPNYSEAYSNLAITLQELGELEKALKNFEKAFSLKPEKMATANAISSILSEINDPNISINYYKKIIELSPALYIVHFNLGIAYQELNFIDKAINSYKEAINLNPEFSDAYLNLGLIYEDSGMLDDSLNSLERAIEIDPDNSVALNNLGITLKSLGRVDDAIKSFEKAIDIEPDNPLGHFNLGLALRSIDKIDYAIKSFEKTIDLNPNSGESYYYLGELFRVSKQHKIALSNFNKAFSINQDIDFLFGSLLNTKMHLSLWEGLEENLKTLTKKINNNERVVTPFTLMALIDDPKIQSKASQIYANFNYPQSNSIFPVEPYQNHKKIRIGYFSADYHNHPTMHLMAELFELHDREKFEIFAFSFGPNEKDKWRKRASLSFDQFLDVRLKSDSEISLLSREMEIDIAIDLGGYTQSTRTGVFANFAAPIQVNFLVFPGTMGANYYDYIVADHTLITSENKDHFSEKIVYMPNSYQSNLSERVISNVTISRSDLGLPEEGFVFSCFNNIHKIVPQTFESWMRILKSVDKSVLWLYANKESVISNISETASQFGVDRNRIIFAKHLPVEEHLNRIGKAGLFLDTLPYNAHTTASDALRMGVPVLTLIGKSFASRVAASLLNAVNMPELITNTQQQYESMAIELASNSEKLDKIKRKLNENLPSSALFDCRTFTKNLELAYGEMYQKSQSGLKPNNIVVRDLSN